jgi:hypothetical protein
MLVSSVVIFVAAGRILTAQELRPEPGDFQPRREATVQVFAEATKTASAADEVTRKLITILDDETERPADRSQAIQCLDRFHSIRAIRPLLENLLLSDPDITEPGPLESFPAARALAHYGRPVYAQVWAVAASERPKEYWYVLAFVLQSMDGEDVALLRLQELLNKPQPVSRQEKQVRGLLQLVRELDFSSPAQWPRAFINSAENRGQRTP